MRKQYDYTPALQRMFQKFKELLIPYCSIMKVQVDQKDSFYLAFPNQPNYKDKAGMLFAAVQIRDATVSIYLPLLMVNRSLLPENILKDISGYIDPNGVIHVLVFSQDLWEALRQIIKISGDFTHTGAYMELMIGK